MRRPELVSRADEMGTDFAVAEECNRYDECEDYRSAYGDRVFVIEYRRQDFDKGCRVEVFSSNAASEESGTLSEADAVQAAPSASVGCKEVQKTTTPRHECAWSIFARYSPASETARGAQEFIAKVKELKGYFRV